MSEAVGLCIAGIICCNFAIAYFCYRLGQKRSPGNTKMQACRNLFRLEAQKAFEKAQKAVGEYSKGVWEARGYAYERAAKFLSSGCIVPLRPWPDRPKPMPKKLP